MSTVNRHGVKVVLSRDGVNHFWQIVQRDFAAESGLKWKYLAMLALRENAGWSLEHIGLAFGHPKGHVSRVLEKIKQEIQDRFQVDWAGSHPDDPTPSAPEGNRNIPRDDFG